MQIAHLTLFTHGSLDAFEAELQIVKQLFPFEGKRISGLPVTAVLKCLKKHSGFYRKL